MPNYKLGKIYKLVSNNTKDIYIGSTCYKYLSKRLCNHRHHRRQYLEGKRKYDLTASNILKYDDCQIILIEDYPCDSKDQLLKRERHWIESLECVNKYIPYRENRKEIRDNWKKKNPTYYSDRYNEKKEEINKRKNQKIECECGCLVVRGSIARHRKTQKHINLSLPMGF